MKSSTASCWQKARNNYSLYLNKPCSAYILFMLISLNLTAQTLFNYGRHAVSKDEFLNAYNQNNSDTNRISYNEYLELYARFKLKVQAALDARLDTTAEQKNELESFRLQLADNFLKDDASTKMLVEEAFERSLKDINLSYIYAPVYSADSTEINAASKKIREAYTKLQNGESFEKIADSYEHGSVGFITVFVLPYVIENVAYTTLPGKYSAPFKTASGFYILKNNKERKAVGKVRVAQILLAFHPGMTDNDKQQVKRHADSLYNDLLEGGHFTDSAKKLSNDNLTFQNGGEMPAFGVGQYDTAFTNAAFALQKDGEISSPVLTSFGYHILTRLQRIDVSDDSLNAANMEMMKEKVLQSDRMQAAQANLVKTIRNKIEKDAAPGDLVSDSAVLEYYRRHMESYNKQYAEQIKEFREGNLLFGVMQKKVWDASAADTAALRRFYDSNKSKYNWEKSADAVIVTCSDPRAFDSTQTNIKNNPGSWKQIAESSNGQIQADSGRFELSQIPVAERTNFTEGLITASVTNDQDSSKTFAYIIRLHNEREPKEFEDAKGSVINDYQVYLEEQWINELKKKYPVKINKKVFKRLPPMN
ncbi:MAG TPA: peptidylprolyl isomerase [Flavitalea sp.]|nr:peptidylprolyl isomerase [Flavitalea sp.]